MSIKRESTWEQGKDVARMLFAEWGLPYLRDQQPHIVDRVAAILCLGSDSLGNDDELSRDHNWGPRFTLVLTGPDKRRYGRKLQRDLHEAAPGEWKGHSFRHNRQRVPVESLNQYLVRLVGVSHAPTTVGGWKRTREENLYMVRHATVFHDPLGEFSRGRKAGRGRRPAGRYRRTTGEVRAVASDASPCQIRSVLGRDSGFRGVTCRNVRSQLRTDPTL